MNSAYILAFGALLLLATPAFAEGWRVESVTGDAVSVKGDGEPEPLSQGDIVPEGATVVSDAQTSVKLSRQRDKLSLSSDTIIVLRPGAGTARASVEAKTGEVEIAMGASVDNVLEVTTRFFRLAAGEADFTVKARKDFATVNVDGGQVQVDDPKHAGGYSHWAPAAPTARSRRSPPRRPKTPKPKTRMQKPGARPARPWPTNCTNSSTRQV
jgi:hypothetical protein